MEYNWKSRHEPYIYGQLIQHCAKTVQWAKDSIFKKKFSNTINNNPKSQFLPLPYAQNDSKWIKDPKVRVKV